MSWKCEICGWESYVEWTDKHGEAECATCGAPYQILHYDENNKRIEKESSLNIKEEYIPYLKQYWEEKNKYAPNGSFMGFRSKKQRQAYEDFNEWLNINYKETTP
jgi:ribosomal protein L37E